jgi:hypothetical protein
MRLKTLSEREADMESSKRLALFRGIVVLACSALVIGCSPPPPEPAPEFTLPLAEVSAAPPAQGEAVSAPRQLRYVAVPPGQHVAGMAHARIVVKQKKGMQHRHRHAQKKAVVSPASAKEPTETAAPTAKP